jgi:hypothetical protein
MKTLSTLIVLTFTLTIPAFSANAQSRIDNNAVKATPAFEVLILKRATVRAELTQQRQITTIEHPDVVRLAFHLDRLNVEIERLLLTEASQISKLSSVYGHLLLRKIDLEVEANTLRQQVTSTHPDLRKKRIEIDALQREIDLLLR